MKVKKNEFGLIITTLVSAFIMKVIGCSEMNGDLKLIQTIFIFTSLLSSLALCILYFKASSLIYKAVQFLFFLTFLGSLFKMFHWPGASIIQLIGLSSLIITSLVFVKHIIDERESLMNSNILILFSALLLLIQIFFVFTSHIELAKQINFLLAGIGIIFFMIGNKKEDLVRANNILTIQSLLVVFSLVIKSIV